MAHYATNRFTYWGQLGILIAFIGAGIIVGGIGSMIPLLGTIELFKSGTSFDKQLENLLKPENASILRWSQTIGTVFIFLIPTFLYARICHVKAGLHLGFKKTINWKQAILAILIMLACLPAVDALQQFTEMLPWSKATLAKFDKAEADYFKQVAVIARMNDFWDYLISVAVIALLPAMVEEMFFRGGMQNLFSRWFKKPVLAIIITSIIFSAIHGSYLGFLSRFALGFVLGWMYYRTGNIWLNIIAHFFNNAVAISLLYFTTKPGEKLDPSKMDSHSPLWLGALSIAALIGLLIAFDKAGKKDIDRPGEEVLIPGYSNNPFTNDIAFQQSSNQQ
ncbi:MAG: CPBP family intramembrane glutamic endopeptidase [Bacteroidota bacterium]